MIPIAINPFSPLWLFNWHGNPAPYESAKIPVTDSNKDAGAVREIHLIVSGMLEKAAGLTVMSSNKSGPGCWIITCNVPGVGKRVAANAMKIHCAHGHPSKCPVFAASPTII
jgi:hypothetical protein